MAGGDAHDYLTPEARARMEIDRQLEACGWVVQDYKHAAVAAAQGVAVRENRPGALIHMATRAGKTFTAANLCDRLLRHAGTQRILFLVGRVNLGRQAVREFEGFNRLDGAQSAIASARMRLEATRRSVPAATFSGRLVAQNFDDEPAVALLTRRGGDAS